MPSRGGGKPPPIEFLLFRFTFEAKEFTELFKNVKMLDDKELLAG
jgi:hypothetical protein